MLIRASNLHLIMTEPKLKSEVLSVGAKTHIEALARRKVYGYDEPELRSKYLDKGILCEPMAIELYNSVNFKSLVKREGRITKGCLTGECDLIDGDKIVDVKCSWSLESFPVTKREAEADAKKAGYEWQGRAYMLLYDKMSHTVAYCMINTPLDLLYDEQGCHNVDHLPDEMKITTVRFERDYAKDNAIIDKLVHAKQYYDSVIKEIKRDHA